MAKTFQIGMSSFVDVIKQQAVAKYLWIQHSYSGTLLLQFRPGNAAGDVALCGES
jgi:hypothetical protein